MLCGMFGKLPSKRDFVSYNMPRPFLDQWEGWLQSAIAASRHALNSEWQETFLGAPIWRFWFGADIYGAPVTGALMPSVDGVGRYFPLSVTACEPSEMRLLPPHSSRLETWHENCEKFLLHMLEDDLADEPAVLLQQLAFAPVEPRLDPPDVDGRVYTWPGDDNGSLEIPFKALEIMNDDFVHGARSYWWTRGGALHQARLVVVSGRADAQFMTSLLTGKFS
jgi:type VI secretion system protein ImpM